MVKKIRTHLRCFDKKTHFPPGNDIWCNAERDLPTHSIRCCDSDLCNNGSINPNMTETRGEISKMININNQHFDRVIFTHHTTTEERTILFVVHYSINDFKKIVRFKSLHHIVVMIFLLFSFSLVVITFMIDDLSVFICKCRYFGSKLGFIYCWNVIRSSGRLC